MLEKEHKAELNRAILKIASVLKSLEDTPADPRAFDMLEIAASLFEQQIEQGIIFDIDDSDNFDESALAASTLVEPGEYYQIGGEEEQKDYDTSGFKFLESVKGIPTAEDLQEQFDIPWPFTP